MSMPDNLVLVRHGESEGNVATNAAAKGDVRWYTDRFITTPGHQWRLTDKGRSQAQVSGRWIHAELGLTFDHHVVSPFVRTRETAGSLAMPGASWRLNRALRERDWGDIGSLPKEDFESRPQYKENAWLKKNDPLYWVAPGGESIAHVAEDRVRNVLSTLHRECSESSVVCVGHGEVFWAFRLVLERMDDELFKTLDADPAEKIHNCEVLHYTRLGPVTGERSPRLSWLRRAYPVLEDGEWRMVVGEWRELLFASYTNEDLLAQVALVPQLFPNGVPEGVALPSS